MAWGGLLGLRFEFLVLSVNLGKAYFIMMLETLRN